MVQPSTQSPAIPADQIQAVRAFSRFYTRFVGALNEGLLSSPFSLTEARLIYELASRGRADAVTLSADLGLDSGYLSRVIGRLTEQGIVSRSASPEDGRVKSLALSSAGEATYAQLNAASNAQIERALAALSSDDRARLQAAMHTIRTVLGESPSPTPYVLRPPNPGDLGWVVQRHGAIYAAEYHWDMRFEGLVAEIVAAFARNFDAQRERCWIAEIDGENVGSVFLVKKSETTAQLRMLLVEPRARGHGIARRLVRECARFARQVGYDEIVLWTNSILTSARRIYETEGYVLVEEEPHESFGHSLVGQYWRLTL
ncbi:MAG: MarR family transcriptional regulator [Gemmatimonadaceae bacterium]|nr:MarR family transcriptional regulator [Gemmatimonadaceae bacterium]